MASLCDRIAVSTARKPVVWSSCKFYAKKVFISDPIEHATGLEKRELLAKAGGNQNLYDMNIIRRGPGTRENPTDVPSAFEHRIMGCRCEPDSSHINYIWLHKGEPRRCECGYWFNLVQKAPL